MIYDELIEELALTLLTKARYEGCISVIDGFSQCEEDKTRIEYPIDGVMRIMPVGSEICAAGPIGSASSVCSYWQNSPAHYANITNASFTSMGVGCWFCQTAEGQYTYWTVTFN